MQSIWLDAAWKQDLYIHIMYVLSKFCSFKSLGGSSGGTLAAAVALAIRNDPSLPKLKAQILANAPLQVVIS